MTDKKGKSARFTDSMNKVLIEAYGKNQVVLKSKFTNIVTNDEKKKIWESITVAVNAVNSGERKSIDQVKKRWEDITTSVKKKDRVARQSELKRIRVTGNGNLPDDAESSKFLQSPVLPAVNSMTSPERQVATILGPQVFVGISGGLDTFDTLRWGENSSTGILEDLSLQEINFEESALKGETPRCYEGPLNSQPGCSKGKEEVIEMSAGAASSGNKRRRKMSLTDAQVEYFEVATKYYKLKMEKVKLEIQALKNRKEE